MSSVQGGGNPQDINQAQQTSATTATSQKGNVPPVSDMATLAVLLDNVSAATEAQPSSSDVSSEVQQSDEENAAQGAEPESGSVFTAIGEKSQEEGGSGKEDRENEGTSGGERAEVIQKHLAPTTSGPSYTASTPVDTSAETNAASATEREMTRKTSQATVSSSAVGGKSVFSSYTPQTISKTMNNLATDMPSYCASIGLPANATGNASKYFQGAATLADRLNNLPDEAPPIVTQKLTQGIQTQVRNGVQVIVHEMVTNPQILQSALSKNFPQGLSSVMAKNFTEMMTTRQVPNTSSSDSSSTATPMNTTASITTMEFAVANFVSEVGLNETMLAEYQTELNEENAQVGADNVQASNTITQNEVNDINNLINEENKQEKKQKSSDMLMGSLGIAGGGMGMATGVALICFGGPVGAVAGVIIIATSASAVATGAGEMQGKNISTTAMMGNALSSVTGLSPSTCTDIVGTASIVVATAAGAATGDPLMAFTMFSTMSEQTGMSNVATAAVVKSAGGNQNQVQEAEMGVNIGLSVAPMLMSGGMACSSMMKSSTSAADAAQSAAEAAKAADVASTNIEQINNAAKLGGATTQQMSDLSDLQQAAIASSKTANQEAENAKQFADAAEKASNSGDTEGFKTNTAKANEASNNAQKASAETQQSYEKAANINKNIQATSSSTSGAKSGAGASSTTAAGASSTTTAGASSTTSTTGVIGKDPAATQSLATRTTNSISTMKNVGTQSSSDMAAACKAGSEEAATSGNTFMGISKAQVAKVCSAIQVTGQIFTAGASAANAYVQLTLAKNLIDMANMQADIDNYKASFDIINTTMSSLNQFTSTSSSTENAMISGLGQENSQIAQNAAADFSHIWELQG